jgi:quinol monooxygenase YgiN
MTRIRLLIAAFAIVLLAGSPRGYAQDSGAIYVVTYFEAAPSARDGAHSLLRKLRDATRKEPGNIGFEVFQSMGQPRHFVLLEAWHDTRVQEAHAAADATKQFRTRLAPMLIAPYDERLHTGFALGPSKPHGKRVVYVITHVDFAGAKKDAGLAAIKQLSAGSMNEAGMLRYDVLEQTVKPNHLTLVEIWRSKAAFEAHEQADHSRRFRDELLPIGGSPLDVQLYRPMN